MISLLFSFAHTCLCALLVTNAIAAENENGSSKMDTKSSKNSMYRLPRSVLPSVYDILLTLDESSKDWNKGSVTITADIMHDVNMIALHADKKGIRKMNNVTFTVNGKRVKWTKMITEDPVVMFHFADMLKPAEISIHINYQWRLQDGSRIGEGAFSNEDYYLLTDMQPYGARRLFPCFDEPAFKAKFQTHVRLVGFKNVTHVLGNMPLKSCKSGLWTFERSKVMSTYLFAVAVLKEHMKGPIHAVNQGYNVSVWIDHNEERAKEKASRTAATFAIMTNLTGMRYPVEKVDYAYSPHLSWAMENWGLIIGRFAVVHEAIHGWFGNMVTCAWWNDIWLNEALTEYYTKYIVREILQKTFPNQRIASKTKRKVRNTRYRTALSSEKYIDDNYWSFVYVSGPEIIRMWHKALGETFDQRIKVYLNKYKWQNVRSRDFIDTMTHENETEWRRMLDTFTFKVGMPKVTITFNKRMNHFSIEQKPRYKGTQGRWQLPLWYRETSKSKENLLWLSNKTETPAVIQLRPGQDPRQFQFDQHCFAYATYVLNVAGNVTHFCKLHG